MTQASKDQAPRKNVGRGPVDWPARLPLLSDADIASLLSNATRLKAGSADRVQAEAAADLLPAIEEELAARRARRAAAAPKKPAKAPPAAARPNAAK